MITDRQIAELALDAGWVSINDLKRLVPQARDTGQPLARVLAETSLDEDRVTFLQACALGLAFARPDQLRVSRRAHAAIPQELQRKYRLVPLRVEPGVNGDSVYFAALPESAADLAQLLSELLGIIALPVAASASSITRTLESGFPAGITTDDAQALDLDAPADPRNYTPPLDPESAAPPAGPNMQTDADAMVITSVAEF